jgi:hypothetical protein
MQRSPRLQLVRVLRISGAGSLIRVVMTCRAKILLMVLLCLPVSIIGLARARADTVDGPTYQGKSLSAWADDVLSLNHLSNVANTNYLQVRAIRAIGTNALPWLLTELAKGAETDPVGKEQVAQLKLPEGSEAIYHQLRARACFWALGEEGAPAIPGLQHLLTQQPEFAPSALAGIGTPALVALEQCLTNSAPHDAPAEPRGRIVGSALGGLYVAIDTGRISRPAAAHLLPEVRRWAAQEKNRDAAYWANGVIRILESGQ